MDPAFEAMCVNRELHSVLFAPICSKYHLTHTEMVVLLFLNEHNENQEGNTAADIVECLKFAKSHVSTSVRDLMERGLLQGNYEGRNHRSIHLQLCESAKIIVKEGQKVQKEFSDIIYSGFTSKERESIEDFYRKMLSNANQYIKSHS